MMPQKRNPDALELARGSAARMLGNLTTLLATLKGLPSSYNKDLQDDKRVLFDATDTLLLVLPAVAGALAECAFRPERMRAALSSTHDGDRSRGLSRAQGRDVPRGAWRGRSARARERDDADGRCRRCRSRRSPRRIRASREDVYEALSAERSVVHREVEGGTGPAAVRAQLEAAQAALAPPPTPRSTNTVA